jgi:WD40 repeat protein
MRFNAFQAHADEINRIKQSPFNNYVATCSSLDESVIIWSVYSSTDWQLIRTYYDHSSAVRDMEWLDPDTLASSGFTDGLINLWSISTGKTKRTIETRPWVYSLKILNNKIHLAVGVGDDINIYDINDGKLFSTLKGHENYVNDLVQINSYTLASASDDQLIHIWDLTTNKTKFTLQGHTQKVNVLKLITSNILASGSDDSTILLWDVTSGQLIRNLTGHTDSIKRSLDLIDNGQTLVSGSNDQTIIKWNWKTGECLSTITTRSDITSLAVINLSKS